MPLAAPLILPFAELAGITIAGLGMAAASKKVSDFISDNPEISTQILTTLVPGGVGLNALFKKKAKEDSDDESVEVAPEDKTREERAKEMKKRFKEGKGDKREIGKKGFEEVIKPVKDIEDLLEGEERYDGSLEDAPKPKFDYKKFIRNRNADGGAIGIEVLFEEKKNGGRIGFANGGDNIIGADLKKDPYEQYQDKFQEAFDISKNYPSNSLGPFVEQGMSSDMRHQLGASGGKDTIIDYLSNFGINPQGKFADTVGNLGIGAATALTEIPDAFKMASEAMKRKDIDALTSGKFLTQPLEDVRSNFAAMNIPYGLTTQEKENLILSNYPGYVPNITTPNYSYGTAAAADFQDGQILQPNVVPERIAPATYYNSAPNFNADVLREEEDAQYNLPQKNMLQNLKDYLPFIGDKSITGMLTRGIGQFFNNIGDRIPSTPQYQRYTPGYNYGNLNPNLIDDFYDPATGLNRFDRAKTLFGQSRTLSEFLSKRRETAAAEAESQRIDAANRANVQSYIDSGGQSYDSQAQGTMYSDAASLWLE